MTMTLTRFRKNVLTIGFIAATSVALSACDSSDSNSDSGGNAGDNNNNTEQVPQNTQSDAAPSSEIPGETSNTAIGEVFVFGPQNRSLYTFANDTDGVSNCNGGCAETWPPILAETAQNDDQFSTISRNDASLQWAFKGRPLYYYQGDGSQGEVNGEGLGGVWFVARPNPITSGPTTLGTVLTSSGSTNAGVSDAAQRNAFDGRTLYTFANDVANTSNCNDGCASNWPPLYADKGAISNSQFTVITRGDGTTQWAYNTQPLYYYAGDNAAGDVNGDGLGGVWSVAKP